MSRKWIDAEQAVSMSLAVLITGLLMGGISQVADAQYVRAEAFAKQEMAQQQVAKVRTRSGSTMA